MVKKILAFVLAGMMVMGVVAGCGSAKSSANADAPEIKAIKSRGVLKAGVKIDVPKFGYKDPKTEKIDGFEIDLVRAIAKEILGDEKKIELTGVNAKTRGPALDNGEVDLVVATFTITEERKKSWNFTDAYFTDSVGFLVKKDGPKSIKDLNGKKVGVAQAATTKKAVQAEADKAGVKVEFLEFTSYPEIKAALDAGRVDAFSVDKSILFGYVDDKTTVLPDAFSPQDYGAATKLDNKELAKLVNDVVNRMKKNGDIDKLLKKWGIK